MIRLRWILPLLATMVSAANARDLPYEVIPLEAIDQTALSEAARSVLAAQPASRAGRSPHFTIVAANIRALSTIFDEAEAARRHVLNRLHRPEDDPVAGIILSVHDAAVWQQMVRRYALRPDGLALQAGRELFINDDPDQSARPDRIAHEVVHLTLAGVLGTTIPLWLDEGLAGVWGWEAATDIQARRGQTLHRRRPAIPPQDLLSLDALLRARAYPKSPAAARAFYRQAEEFVVLLAARTGEDRWPALLGELARPQPDPVAALKTATALDAAAYAELEQTLIARCAEESL